jgi:peptidoglycan/xylan/chitin deacetylase (PgdA/CDA1 family)
VSKPVKKTPKFEYRNFALTRVLPITLIMIVFGYGVYFYARHQESIHNFRPHYYKAYETAIRYKLSNPLPVSASSTTTTSVPVLVYHGLVAGESSGEDTSISDFSAQMLALKQAGYRTISIQEYYDFIYNNRAVPEKSFLLTFDDGRKDSYYASQPLLEAFGFRATMFVITSKSLSGRTSVYYLSENELKSMKKSGHWDIQAHTRDGHEEYPIDPTNKAPYFANKLWLKDKNRLETDLEYRERVRADLQGAKIDIQSRLGITPVSFAVPFGDIGERSTNYPDASTVLLSELKSAFPLTFIQATPGRPHAQNYLGSDEHLNLRIEPKPGWTTEKLLHTLESTTARSLPFTSKLDLGEGWQTPWGNSFTNEGLHVTSGATTTGGTITLDGTYGWRDYTVTAKVKVPKGSSLRIIMRQQDSDTYVACSYNPEYIHAQQVRDGTAITLTSERANLNLERELNYTATVKGNRISCGATAAKAATAVITDPGLTRSGGMGFVVYDETTNNAEGVITKLEVAVAR